MIGTLSVAIELPTDDASRAKLEALFSLFHALVQRGVDEGDAGAPSEEFAVEADEFLRADIALAIEGIVQPPSGDVSEWLFWSLHRSYPRWGAAWAGLDFNDLAQSMVVKIRTGGSVLDDEDPPIWVRCYCRPDNDVVMRARHALQAGDGCNFWIRKKGEVLELTLTFVRAHASAS